jgi:hypothetical protein
VSATAWVLLVPLALQALAMTFDELYFHRRRGLGAWERLGHPLDTLTFLACITFLLVFPPTPRAVVGYVGLAAFSCLFVTKDEAVHARCCSAAEHWIHAVLFVLHPVCLASLGVLWPGLHSGNELIEGSSLVAHAIPGQLMMTAAFCLFQTLYWNLRCARRTPPTT